MAGAREPIRILVVDDSSTYRNMVSRALNADQELAVVGTAADGAQALEKLVASKIDLVILDVEMPVMDGLATLKEIRRRYPKIAVIMFSALTAGGAKVAIEAMSLGAADCVGKPSTEGAVTLDDVRLELTRKIKAVVRGEVADVAAGAEIKRPATSVASNLKLNRVQRPDVIAVGASTGGPKALQLFFSALPKGLPSPVVVVIHMPPVFTDQLAQKLARDTGHPVSEVKQGERLQPGQVYIAPGDWHFVVERRVDGLYAQLHQGAKENWCRPSVDVLFRSIADVFGHKGIAVELTGMGKDGLEGARLMVAQGGEVLAQDQASATVGSMPGSIADAGLASRVLPPDQLAVEVGMRFSPAERTGKIG